MTKSNGTISIAAENRALRALQWVGNNGITYKLGAGGRTPAQLPYVKGEGELDCSGFVAWCCGYDRFQEGLGWINTDALEKLSDTSTSFIRVSSDEVAAGDIVVYGAGAKIGHTGIVVAVGSRPDVENKASYWVAHCRGPVGRNPGVVLTDGGPFVGKGARFVRWVG